MSGPRTLDEWRQASELADAELEIFDRREAARPLMAADAMYHQIGWVSPGEAKRRDDREALARAAEDARLGLLRATHATDPGRRPPGHPELVEAECADEARAARERLAAKGIHHPTADEWQRAHDPELTRKQFRLRRGRWPHLYD